MVTDVFSQLFPGTTTAEFFTHHWPDRPLLFHGGLDRFPALRLKGDIDDVIDRLCEGVGRQRPIVMAARLGGGSTVEMRRLPRWPWLLRQVLRSGSSINAEQIQRSIPEVGTMMTALLASLGLPPSVPHQVETWITPADRDAIDKHCDPDERIVLQLAGRKRWWLQENHELLYPVRIQHTGRPLSGPNRAYADSLALSSRMDGAEEVVMSPGSALFLPRGYWHRTQALEPSCGIMFRFAAPTMGDVLERHLRSRVDNIALRRPLAGIWQGHPSAETQLEDAQALVSASLRAGAREILASFEEPTSEKAGTGVLSAVEERWIHHDHAYGVAAGLELRDGDAAGLRLDGRTVMATDSRQGLLFRWLAVRPSFSTQEVAESTGLELGFVAYWLEKLRLDGYLVDQPGPPPPPPVHLPENALTRLLREATRGRLASFSLDTAPLGKSVDRASSFAILDAFVGGGGSIIEVEAARPSWSRRAPRTLGCTGEWLRVAPERREVLVATRARGAAWFGGDEARSRLGRRQLTRTLEANLLALGGRVIDLLWVDGDTPERPVADVIDTLESFVERGWIRFYGASNWTIGRLQEAQSYAHRRGGSGFAARAADLSLAHLGSIPGQSANDYARGWHERTSFPWFARAADADGYFSMPAAAAAARGFIGMAGHTFDGLANRRRQAAAMLLAEELGCTPRQVAWAYALGHAFPVVASLRAGASSDVAEAAGAGDLRLSSEQRRLLEGR